MTPQEVGVHARLGALGIVFERYEHPPVATAEEAEVHWAAIDAMHFKNLFLRNQKGTRHYLLIVRHPKRADLRTVANQLGDGKLSFASPERLMTHLGVTPGSVSPFGLIHDRETVVRATSLRDGDIDPSLPIQTVSTGLPFTVVPLRGLDVMRRLQVNLASSSQYLKQSGGGTAFYFVTRETVDPAARLHARMLFYGGEDPATGSAAGCATAWMVAHGVAQPDEHVLIEQGVEMLRPSRILVRASRRDNKVVNVRVGGNAVEVLRGEVSF
jgi:trans-2,3-dihydro-3-hydroxyanthranilate isomerase